MFSPSRSVEFAARSILRNAVAARFDFVTHDFRRAANATILASTMTFVLGFGFGVARSLSIALGSSSQNLPLVLGLFKNPRRGVFAVAFLPRPPHPFVGTRAVRGFHAP